MNAIVAMMAVNGRSGSSDRIFVRVLISHAERSSPHGRTYDDRDDSAWCISSRKHRRQSIMLMDIKPQLAKDTQNEKFGAGNPWKQSMKSHAEYHRVDRVGWLRAAVLGANDGIISTASLIVGVAAASTKPGEILLTAIAGLVAGSMAMAAGEYVSVSSQADTEHADLARERGELATDVAHEREELERNPPHLDHAR